MDDLKIPRVDHLEEAADMLQIAVVFNYDLAASRKERSKQFRCIERMKVVAEWLKCVADVKRENRNVTIS